MNSPLINKQELLKSFLPLSEAGKNFLEVVLVSPKIAKVEGRGFFNDTDFLMEASKPLVGRFNFCLTNYAYSQEQIPTRAAYNQFDRSLLDSAHQENSRAHSLSLSLLFRTELIRELSTTTGEDPLSSLLRQVDAVMGRMNIKNYCLDYFLTGVTARCWAPGALAQRPLNRNALITVMRRFLEDLEKRMSLQEQKRFALAASVMGKLWDPMPGLPGLFAGEAMEPVVVTSTGSLEPPEDTVISAFLDDVFEPKPNKAAEKDSYTMPNIEGLSQNWQESQYEPDGGGGLAHQKGIAPDRDELSDPKARETARELVGFFQAQQLSRWRWPIYSAAFTKVYQGAGCGEMLLLQCDPFAAELGFHFLAQCAESFAKEGGGQILLFSKKRTLGDLGIGALARHYKSNPLSAKQGSAPDGAGLAKVFTTLFPNLPQTPPCGRGDGLEQLLKYLEHDYLLQQKKKGGNLMPLAILIDNLDEFCGDDDSETFKRLSQLKTRLREFNGTLWVTQLRPVDSPRRQAYLALADYLALMDHDGALEAQATGRDGRAPRPQEWESGFHVDLTTEKLMQEFCLLKMRFQAHGSHRYILGHYAFHRSTYLFREINPAPGSAHAASAPAASAAVLAASASPGISRPKAPLSGPAPSGPAPSGTSLSGTSLSGASPAGKAPAGFSASGSVP